MKKIDINNAASIREGIKSVCNRSASLQGDIQKVAVATLYHTHTTGDWTLSRTLIEGISLNKGVKSAKLTQYFEAFMAAEYTQNEKGENVFVYDDNKSAADISVEQAELVNWFDFKAAPKDNTKTIEEIQASVVKMFAASIKTGKAMASEQEIVKEIFDALITARNSEDGAELELVVNA